MRILIVVFCFFRIANLLWSQTPVLVKDIHPGATSGYPDKNEYPVAIGNILYFAADDGIHGLELWRSDGTETGTYLVKDIRPDTGSAPIRLTVLNNKILFFANDGVHGDELWISDGTENGTTLVRDIYPGSGNVIRRNYITQKRDWKVSNNVFYFAADTDTSFSQLWRSDGTAQGTFFIADVCPTCLVTSSSTGHFETMNDTLYFVAALDLWRSDGTAAGTEIVMDNLDTNGPGSFRTLTAVNGLLYMSGGSFSNGPDLWVSDGTNAGTRLIKDFPIADSDPRQFVGLGNQVYFISGTKLWVTDGTEAGTVAASDLRLDNQVQKKNNLYVWKNELYYKAMTPELKCFIYKTDGSPNGETQVFTQFDDYSEFPEPVYYASTDEFLFYDAADNVANYAAVGRISSPDTLKELIPVNDLVEYLMIAGDNLFFRAKNDETGEELWKISLGTTTTRNPGHTLALSLYPTLSTEGVFYFDYSGSKTELFDVCLYDMSGRLAYRNTQTPEEPLRVPNLNSGTYLIQITARSGDSISQKVVIGKP